MLLDSIGGSLKGRNDYRCCDVCSPDLFYDERFDIFQVQSVERKRRRAVRKVEHDLKYTERDLVLVFLVFVSCVQTQQLTISAKKPST